MTMAPMLRSLEHHAYFSHGLANPNHWVTKSCPPLMENSTRATLGINRPPIFATLSSSSQPRPLSSSPLVYPIANTVMLMRTILALSLAAFALAVPVAQPQGGLGADLSAFCSK